MLQRGVLLVALIVGAVAKTDDEADGMRFGTPPDNFDTVPSMKVYDAAVKSLVIEDVMTAIKDVMTDSKAWWPADYGNYGPFFVRLAWHCSGTYRDSDGRGGCSGGRQRFEPERNWEDNTNLDKARALLWPVKKQFGDALSWGDLFTLAGTTAIAAMGGPIAGPCVGRVDEPDGTSSLDLGPSPQQEKVAPCGDVNGKCKKPLGSTTLGLIYLNPEGPVEKGSDGTYAPNPDPKKTAATVRDAFGRMGFNAIETMALIGGGHAFGKTHGACPNATGPGPHWAGNCGTGIGNDTVTSGFEGAWTTTPTKWSNEFWSVLTNNAHKWEKHKGPGGHWQWRIKGAEGALANVMRLTSDVSLLHDPEFLEIATMWAKDSEHFDKAFAAAWFTLTTDGGRWSQHAKCLGDSKVPTHLRIRMRGDDVIV